MAKTAAAQHERPQYGAPAPTDIYPVDRSTVFESPLANFIALQVTVLVVFGALSSGP
jgi:hypothetical protein